MTARPPRPATLRQRLLITDPHHNLGPNFLGPADGPC